MNMFSDRTAVMMDEDLAIFRNSVGKFLDAHASPEHVLKWRKNKVVDRELWTKAAEAGLLGLSVPAEYGGAGADFRFEAVLIEELHYRGLECFGAPNHNAVIAPYIVNFGTEEQKQRWLPKMCTGELIAGIAMTEPGTGSDLRGIRTTARRDGDHYVINGQKTFISNGMTGNIFAVVCQTGDSGAPQTSIIFVETDKVQGFERGRNLDKLGLEACDTLELFFNDVRVPVENLLGEAEGLGMRQMMSKLPQERLMISIQAAAAIERALTETIAYVKQRRAFGKTIMEFQNTQFKLAECKTKGKIARVFVDHCIDRHLKGELDSETASMAKYWTTETQTEIIDECLQLHGGYGYMLEYPIAQMYRDTRVQKIYGGSNEIMKVLIARGL
jgi:acyl-CoA dehydrogenase